MNTVLKYAYMILICRIDSSGQWRNLYSQNMKCDKKKQNKSWIYSSQNYLHINSILLIGCAEEEESSVAEV